MVLCLVLHLSMPRVNSCESSHERQKYAMWKKKGVFWNILYTCQLSLFKHIVEYYFMDIHMLIVTIWEDTAWVGRVSLGSAKIGSYRQSAEFFLVYLFCMLDSTSCITYPEMLRVCNASIEWVLRVFQVANSNTNITGLVSSFILHLVF